MRPRNTLINTRNVTNRIFALSLAAILPLALTACGSGEDAIDGAAGKPNAFPPAKNPLDDFRDGTTGDSNNAVGLKANEVRVTVEAPPSFAPEGELTRRNLRIVTPDRIDVYRIDQTLQNLGSVNTRRRSEDNGREVIEFVDGLPLGPNVIIDVQVGNTRMRALATDSDRDVKVNPYSEYLVSRVLRDYTASEFDRVMACVNSGSDDLCLNKYVWSTLADQVHDFEIDVPDGLDLDAAVDHLAGRADYVRYVDAVADYALLDQQSSGKIEVSSADYNSVLLGVELGQSFLVKSGEAPGQWGVRTAQEERIEDDRGVAYVFPGLTLTSFDVFNIRVTSLAGDVPYDRETTAQTKANDFFARGTDYWRRNTHATSPGAATLEDDLRLLAGRALYQSITGRGSSRIIGWTRNPYFLDAYVGGGSDEPDRVFSGYFSAGKAIELRVEGDELKREKLLEDHYVSFLDLNLERVDDYDLSQLSGQGFNVLTLSMRTSDPSEPVAIESGLGTWNISGQDVQQQIATQVVARDSGGTVTNRTGTRDGNRLISHRPSRLSNGTRNIGRLNLDLSESAGAEGRADFGVGASSPDGSLLAFNLDNNSTGDGILVAARQTDQTPPTIGRYRLQGMALGMDDNENRLAHYDNALLSLTSGSVAELTLNGLHVAHDVGNESVTEPTFLATQDRTLAYADNGDGKVSFTDGDFILEGFVTADQEQFFLQLRNLAGPERTLGVVLATRLPD